MGFTALDDYHSIPMRSELGRFEFSCEVRLSSFALVRGARLVILSMLLLLMTLSHDRYGAVGIKFSYNGFRSPSDLYIVPRSNWYYYANDSCYNLEFLVENSVGRILYPKLVQMKSFSTTFIYQIYNHPVYVGQGSGLAFIMVPNNFTIGAPLGFLGLLTTTSTTTKNFASDDQTFGVELDTYLNAEFKHTNDNHIGIDLASMNSTFSYVPFFPLTTATVDLYQQVWIDYYQADSRIDIAIAPYYSIGKPAVPDVSWAPVDLSLLNEPTYIGFSAAVGYGADRHTILAWSFSTEGPAPPISVAKDAPPGTSPPPPARTPAPPPAPSTPAPPGSNIPPTSLRPSSPPPGTPVGLIVGMSFLGIVIVLVVLFCWWKFVQRPLRIFLSHAGGEDGGGKNCAHWLYRELRSNWRLRYRYQVFFDRTNLTRGRPFPAQIKKELEITDLGIVIVTEDFFVNKWPMIELAALVASQTKSPERVRILPLFNKLTPGEIRSRVDSWEKVWTTLSTVDNPIDVEEWKRAVLALCIQMGIPYDRSNASYEVEYIQLVKREVIKMCDKMRNRRRD